MQKLLKEKLLSTGYFIDNQYLDEYVKLTTDSSITLTTYLERHHILPRAYYNLLEIDVDNSDDNLVSLSFANHCKAHWLLYYCTIEKLQYASQTAFVIMVNGLTKRLNDYTDTDFAELQELKNKLIEDSATFWSTSEDEYLRQNFLDFSDEELAAELHRSSTAVQARRSILGLQRFKMLPDYTQEEIDYLIANHSHKEIAELAAHLNRPIGSVAAKCSRLGLKKWHADPWSEDELEFLYKNSATMSAAEISKALGRGLNGVHRQCRIHKITCCSKRTGYWTDYELAYLAANSTTKTVTKMAEELERPLTSVRRKCLNLGLIKVQNPRKIVDAV